MMKHESRDDVKVTCQEGHSYLRLNIPIFITGRHKDKMAR